MPAHELDPPLIRILLVRSSTPVLIPQPGRAYRVTADGRSSWLWGPLDLRVTASGQAWWQVGAFTDSITLSSASERLKIGLGPAVQIASESNPDGLTRLRVRWPAGSPPDPGAVLEDLGFPGAFLVAAPGVLRIEDVEGKSVSTGGEVLIEPAGEWPVAVDGGRYRGRLLARAVGNETLVINELNLEFYLRGVVPAEMGPSQFPELDALKAQTVAARTYAVAHVGDHADEGWDLCDTPACQVYRGVRVEHRLSNRAVEETAGLVAVFAGEPIDAMYTSTCGGHTENVSLLFEGRAKPYLAGVPCVWDRPIQITGLGPTGPWLGSTDFSAAVAFDVLLGTGRSAWRDPSRGREVLRHFGTNSRSDRSGRVFRGPSRDSGRGSTRRDRSTDERSRTITFSCRSLQDPPRSADKGSRWFLAGCRSSRCTRAAGRNRTRPRRSGAETVRCGHLPPPRGSRRGPGIAASAVGAVEQRIPASRRHRSVARNPP